MVAYKVNKLTPSPFFNRAVLRLQKRFIFVKRYVLALDIMLCGAALGLTATVMIKLTGWFLSLWTIHGAILVLALFAFILLAWRIRISPMSVLIRTDGILRSQECLSTAYEYLHQQENNTFLPGLAIRADRISQHLNVRTVFPVSQPRRFWAIPVLIAAIVVFSLLEITPLSLDSKKIREVDQSIVQHGKRLERWGLRLEKLAGEQQMERNLSLARDMRKLGRDMQQQNWDKKQAGQRLANLSDYVQRILENLSEQAPLNKGSITKHPEAFASGRNIKQELSDLLQLLDNNTQDQDMARQAEQGIRRLSLSAGQDSELESLLRNLQAGNIEVTRRMLQDLLSQQQAREEMEHLEQARQALEYSSRAIKQNNPGDSAGGQPGKTGDNSNSETSTAAGDEMVSEGLSGLEDPASTGFYEGFGFSPYAGKGQQQPLPASAREVDRVKTIGADGSVSIIYMRSLPVKNEARQPIENVLSEYRKAAEEILSHEKIPREYREQVKQYFLSIGMTK